jgi:hypothetical protein
VYWIWPVKTGTKTRYERIILSLINTQYARITVPANVSGIRGLTGALSAQNARDARLVVNRAFLVAFAREIIKGQANITEDATAIGQVQPPSPAILGGPPRGQPTERSVHGGLQLPSAKAPPSRSGK